MLDLARLDADGAAFLADLRHAARTFGFFNLGGHGIDPRLPARILDESQRFFALPEQEKQAIAMIHSPHFRGYTAAGQEITRGRADWREQIDFGAERPTLPSGPGTPAWARLQGPNQWRAAQPSLRPVVEAWQAACQVVVLRLLRAFALGQRDNVFDASFAEAPTQHLKIIHYPPRDRGESDQGVGAHKDSCFLTLLMQDGVKGLEVESPVGGWIAADPVPGRSS